MSTLPLEGIRVIDLSQYIAGPYCTKLFADFGADVIKIEKPSRGDGSRWMPQSTGDIPDPEKNPLFLYLNTNKRGVVLDLKTKEGIQTIKKLVQNADILVESFRPGVMDRMGINYHCLERLNPGLVMTSLSNFGQTGPYWDWHATELTLNALSGMMLMTGSSNREPLKLGLSQVQYCAGSAAAVATLSAYRYQRLTGHGQYIDISLLEPFLNMLHQNLCRYGYIGSVQNRTPDNKGFPWLFQTSNGWVHVSGLQTKALVAYLKPTIPEVGNPKFIDPEHWQENAHELSILLTPWFLQKTKLQVTEEMQKQGIIAAPINTEADLLESQQLTARDYFEEITHPVAGKGKYPGRFFVSDQIAKIQTKAAPMLGQHTDEVLAEINKPRLLQHKGLANKIQSGDPNKILMPLSGIRILSCEHWAALPHATKYLASLGAEVIVVEAPSRARSSPTDRISEESGGLYIEGARNKLGIAIDLSKPKGVDLFKRLAGTSDVVVDNFTPRVMKNLGIDYEALRKVKSDIIALSISGFGRKGFWDHFRGYTLTAEVASGLSNLTGYINGLPGKPGGSPFGDMVPALHAAWVILLALEHRERTGNGAEIDISMIEPCTCQIGEAVLGYSLNQKAILRTGNRSPNSAPGGCYPCIGENNWVTIDVITQEQWEAFVKLMGNPSWANDKRFDTKYSRLSCLDDIDGYISEWTRKQDKISVMIACQNEHIPAGAVLHVREVMTNEHLMARGSFEMIRVPPPPAGAGNRLHLGVPWKLSKTPASTRMMPPIELGEHNEYVYKTILGLQDNDLAELEKEGVTSKEITGPLHVSLDRLPRRFDDREKNYLNILGLQ